jgi:hypothetical protein
MIQIVVAKVARYEVVNGLYSVSALLGWQARQRSLQGAPAVLLGFLRNRFAVRFRRFPNSLSRKDEFVPVNITPPENAH